jgi:hypothetical protein
VLTGTHDAIKPWHPYLPDTYQQPSMNCPHRQRYAVATEREVTIWQVQHELAYNILRGGHDKAVISLYACAGGPGGTAGERDYR